MAFQDVSSPSSFSADGGIFAKIGSALGDFVRSLMTASAAARRVELVERLQSKSDAELAHMNIRRSTDSAEIAYEMQLHLL